MRRIEVCELRELGGKTRDGLQALWRAAFGDTAAYVGRFFDEACDGVRAAFTDDGGEYPSALYLLPASIQTAGGRFEKADLVFALATGKGHEGRGLATDLLDYVNGLGATFLKPADEGLFGFYGARGYKTGFWVTERVVVTQISPKPSPKLKPAAADFFTAARDRYLSGDGFVKWSEAAVNFAIADEAVYGGKAVAVCEGAALYNVEAGEVVVKELATPPEAVDEVAALLMRQEGVDRCSLRLSAAKGEAKPFGMVRGLNVGHGYFGLAMD